MAPDVASQQHNHMVMYRQNSLELLSFLLRIA